MQQQSKVASSREESQGWMTWSLALGSFVMVFALTMVFLGQYAILVQTHYQVVALRDHQKRLDREKDLMQLKLQSLSSLERVESLARNRLKMVPSMQRQVLDLRNIQANGQVIKATSAKN